MADNKETEKDRKTIKVFNGDSRVKTIADFLETQYMYNITPKDFLDLNRQYIFDQWTYKELIAYADKIGKKDLGAMSPEDLREDAPLPCPATFEIYAKNVTREIAINQTNLQAENNDFIAFADDKVSEVLNAASVSLSNDAGALLKREPKVKVYAWCKSLYYAGTDRESYENALETTQDSFVNLSKYVMSLSTLSGGEGGSFSIRFPIIDIQISETAWYDKTSDGAVSWLAGSIVGLGKDISVENENYYLSKSDITRVERNFLSWLLSTNDLIFLSFEDTAQKEDYVQADQVFGQTYDMIGLVDTVTVVTDGGSTNAYVEVTGRDLNKLLIDDGSFFFQVSTTPNPSEVFANQGVKGDASDTDKSDPMKRLRLLRGEIEIFKSRVNMSLSYILKGVISQLANVQIVPGDVFKSWGGAQTSFNELEPKKNG